MERDTTLAPRPLLSEPPRWVRLTHGINAVAVVLMVLSGWQIYNASPLFPFRFPGSVTLGGWLAGGIQWHFAAMWLLAANGLVYLVGNLVTGRFARRFLPVSPRAALADVGAALRGRLAHPGGRYNAAQRLAYLGVMLLMVLLVASGLVLWKPVQFGMLRELLGDYEAARHVHFVAMALLVLFVVVHLVMVVLVPKSLRTMVTGAGGSPR